MRLSRETEDAKIIELYMSGWSYRRLQKRYHCSPNHISRLVRGLGVKCTMCGKPKGKVRFHAHHPDRLNLPDYTIPLCPSCHAKEEARIRRERQNQPSISVTTPSPDLNPEPAPATRPALLRGPISPTKKKVAVGILAADVLFPKLFPYLIASFERAGERYQEKKRRWRGESKETASKPPYSI